MSEPLPQFPKLRLIDATPVRHGGRNMVAVHDLTHLSDGVVLVSEDVAYVLQFMDGHHSLLDLRAAYMRRFGSFLFEEQLSQLVRMLDEQLLLDNERFAQHRREVEEAFRRAPVRESVHAGQSYPAEADELRRLLSSFCQGATDERPGGGPFQLDQLKGCVVPHIDLRAGGQSYGRAYRESLAAGKADLYVVLGTSHAPLPPLFAGTMKPFQTPLGVARTDQGFMESLARQWGDDLFADELAHRSEHTIEFQVLFLQHLFGAEVQIAPVLCSFSAEQVLGEDGAGARVRDFVQALRGAVQSFPGRVIGLASADLSHVGPRYGDPWAGDSNRLALVRRHDQELLQAVASGDAGAVARGMVASQNRFRVCGFPPIYTLLQALDIRGGAVLDYRHAVMDAQGSVVTFAAVALF
ncbi:MAG: AmmeMemoRadiSam system protein B [bacterium]|nr:AmmeMemoRadiSam system protein B [candidate division KSB1 bacterium]MDH7561562.1 AmmeMemoRadiSam system protein B [bacterium]